MQFELLANSLREHKFDIENLRYLCTNTEKHTLIHTHSWYVRSHNSSKFNQFDSWKQNNTHLQNKKKYIRSLLFL